MVGNCIQALTDSKVRHINYRDSKLTRLLQESLGGNAKTSLIVTASPSVYNLDETISSMMFGQRAMKVQNKPVINKTTDYQALSIKLQEDLDKLNDEYAKLKIQYDLLLEKFNKTSEGEIKIRKENSKAQLEINYEDIRNSDLIKLNSEVNSSNVEEIREKCEEEIRKLEIFYESVLKDKMEENEKVTLVVTILFKYRFWMILIKSSSQKKVKLND